MKKKKDLEKELEKIEIENYKLEAEFWKEYYEFRILLNKSEEIASK
jgi:hypothetical protein